MAEPLKHTPKVAASDAAMEALEAASHQIPEAAEILARQAEAEGGEIMTACIREGAKALVTRHRHAARSRFWQAAEPPAPETIGQRTRRALEARSASILEDYVLSTGQRLGDATAADLEAEAAMHDEQARANKMRSAWYRSLVRKMPQPKKPLRSQMAGEAVEALLREAREGAAA